MKKLVLLIIVIFSSCLEKDKFNPELKSELSSILIRDQGFRELYNRNITEKRKSELLKLLEISEADFLENERDIFRKNDSLNLIKIEKIINRYGYPGKSLVGEPENEAAWFVIQHSGKIADYFPIIEKAGQKGELDLVKVAMMKDRLLMNLGEEQLYGSQGKRIFFVWPPRKQTDSKVIIWPIKNPATVNTLRQQIGFKNTVEEYAQSLDIDYKPYTLSEVNQMNSAK